MAKQNVFQEVASKKDLQKGALLKSDFLGKPIVLAMVDGKVYAIDAVCPQEGGPLEDDYEIECPWRDSKFDIRTGALAYEVKLEDESMIIPEKNGCAIEKARCQEEFS